ncbi:MAG TPA: xanthine dehydrogenase family protein molybdopterin-binding subunit [Aggregatilineales bacterium]|nr:xanthine dehydrogenase family protein molybdopterin-binding subunit [Aggregatilineales bacterium]
MSTEKSFALGQSIRRVDAVGKVTGETPYPGDLNIEGQLWMKLRFSDRVHARVLSIDTTAAEALPGVVRIFTAKDVPHNEYGLVMKDQPVLCGPGSHSILKDADVVKCYMDCIAVVVAETEAQAAEAVRLIQVVYEDLPAVFDPVTAMQEGAPQLSPEHPGNILCHYRIRKGDMDAGWAQADVIVEGEYHTGYQEHAYLQPEAGVAYIDEADRVTVVTAGQWVHEDQEQIYHALGLEPDQVRVIYPAIGGAFGGREDMSVQIVLALAVLELRRPVKIQWSREESILYHHKRHPVTIRAKWGATRDGKIVAVESTVIGDAGPYNYTTNKVMGNANLCATGVYEIPNIHVDTYGVLTNNIPTGAFRGFGGPQGAFAAEGQLNKLAQALNMDPVELRARNVFQEGSILSVGTPLPKGVSMPQVVEAAARESGWSYNGHGWQRPRLAQSQNAALRRGIGFAAGFKNIGFSFGFPEQNWATIELHGTNEIEEVIVRQAGADVGQGAHTAFMQMAAEAVGVPFSKVRLLTHDTAETQTSGSASASRLTFMAGNAIRGAAALALEKWVHEERPAIGTFQYRPPKTTPYDPLTGRSEPNFAYGYVAQGVEVEVDIETGHIHVLKVICADDVGKAVNPQQVQGQIEGAVVQAQGYAIMENLISVEGKIKNPYLSTYLIPTVLDIPAEVKSIILEYPDPIGPWGARGMAEMPYLPLAAAICAAVHDATGVWMDTIPLTPDRVVTALRANGIGVL